MFNLKLSSIILALAVYASAYQVTRPNASQGWVSTGANTLSWDRVNTDAQSFDVVLTNVDGSVFARSSQVLESNVDGADQTSITIDTTNLPPGGRYRVNLTVAGSGSGGTIYAQSPEFTISRTGSSSTTSRSTTRSSTTTSSTTQPNPTGPLTTTTVVVTGSTTITVGASSTDTIDVTATETGFFETDTETFTTTETDTVTEPSTTTETDTETTTLSSTFTFFDRARRSAMPQ